MKKNLFQIILLLAAVIIFGGKPVPAKSAIEGPPQEFDVTYRITYENRSKAPARITMKIPVPSTSLPHQKLISLSYSPLPKRLTIDRRGDTLDFVFPRILPGKSAICTIKCTVENRRVIYGAFPKTIDKNPPHNLNFFLRPESRFPVNDPAIRDAVKKIAGMEKSPYNRALKIYDYVRSLKYSLTSRSRPALEVLKTGKCQCRDAADLMITLCRASGIPARFAGGIFLKELDRSTADTHAWVEIYLEPAGWVPADPTMARFNFFTRLSRFAEIDSPYLVLWRDQGAPFHITSSAEKNGGDQKAFSMEIKFQAKRERKGIHFSSLCKEPIPENPPAPASPALPADPVMKAKYIEGVNLFQAGDYKKSEKIFREVIRKEKGFYQGYLYLFQASEGLKALDSLEKEMKAYLSDEASRGPALMVLALIEGRRGRWDKAFSNFSQARSRGFNGAIADALEGNLALESRNLPLAARLFISALKSDPGQLSAFSGLYDILSYLEDYDSMARLSRLGIKVHNMPDFNYQLARASFYVKDYKTAEEELNRAMRAIPQNGALMGLQGQIYIKTGRKKEGIELINKAIKLLPANEADDLAEFLKYNR